MVSIRSPHELINSSQKCQIKLESFTQKIQEKAAAAAKSLQSCPTLCDPIDGTHQAPPSLGFSGQEHWSGLPFPSPMHESEVAQSCPTHSDPMDCSLPGSSVHGIFQARILEWGAIDLNLALQLKRPESINWGTICPVLSF